MPEDRERLTFKRPGEPAAPATVVITTSVQYVDASGVPVRFSTGRAVMPYEESMAAADLGQWAQMTAEESLAMAAVIPEQAEEEPVDPATLTNEQLKGLLDERGIAYPAKCTKAELLELVSGSEK